MLFDSFPPVLQLQLKRFEYDFQRDVMVKVRCFIASTLLLCCEAGLDAVAFRFSEFRGHNMCARARTCADSLGGILHSALMRRT